MQVEYILVHMCQQQFYPQIPHFMLLFDSSNTLSNKLILYLIHLYLHRNSCLYNHGLQQFRYKREPILQMFKNRKAKNKQINIQQIQEEGEQQQHSQPQKRLKIQKPQASNIIGGTTATRKAENQQAVHLQLQTLNYKKGDKADKQEQVLAGDEAIEHETQQAKKKYLENVQMTKKIKQGKLSNKIYRGTNNYANYKLTQSQLQNPQDHYKWKHGPTRASKDGGAKNTCRFDYDPSLCKDWHDSGYCVFGNSCIYLHDRSNYKTGWQLEKDFEKTQRQRWKRITNPGLMEQPDYIKDLQRFKPEQICKYCNQTFKQPVQVSCKHYFCRKCANKILEKDSKCPTCSKRLNGIMNNAQKQLSKQKSDYEQMLKAESKNMEMSQAKKIRYKDTNSLNVFSAQS